MDDQNTKHSIRNIVDINGVAFVRLADVVDFKRAMARPKDFEYIKLINKYLAK